MVLSQDREKLPSRLKVLLINSASYASTSTSISSSTTINIPSNTPFIKETITTTHIPMLQPPPQPSQLPPEQQRATQYITATAQAIIHTGSRNLLTELACLNNNAANLVPSPPPTFPSPFGGGGRLIHSFARPKRSVDAEEDFDFVTQSFLTGTNSGIFGVKSNLFASSGVSEEKTEVDAANSLLLLRYTTVPLSVAREVKDASGLNSGLPDLEDGSSVVVFNEIEKSGVPLNIKEGAAVEKGGRSSIVSEGSTSAVGWLGVGARTMVNPKNLLKRGVTLANKVIPLVMTEESFLNPMILEKQGGYFVLTPLNHEQTRLTLTLKLCDLDEVRRRGERSGREEGSLVIASRLCKRGSIFVHARRVFGRQPLDLDSVSMIGTRTLAPYV